MLLAEFVALVRDMRLAQKDYREIVAILGSPQQAPSLFLEDDED